MKELQLDIIGSSNNVDDLLKGNIKDQSIPFIIQQLNLHIGEPYNKENDSVIELIHLISCSRAQLFNIQSPSHYKETLNILESVIPAISTTNAIVGASAVLQMFNILNGVNIKDSFIAFTDISSYPCPKPNANCKECHIEMKKCKCKSMYKLSEWAAQLTGCFEIYFDNILVYDSQEPEDFPNYSTLTMGMLVPLLEVKNEDKWIAIEIIISD